MLDLLQEDWQFGVDDFLCSLLTKCLSDLLDVPISASDVFLTGLSFLYGPFKFRCGEHNRHSQTGLQVLRGKELMTHHVEHVVDCEEETNLLDLFGVLRGL